MNKETLFTPQPIEDAANCLLIRCFGGLSVSLGTKTIAQSAWRGPSAKALFVYLVLKGRTLRERLMALCWPERDPRTALNNFHSMVRYVRKALQMVHSEGREFIVHDGPFYAFRPGCPYVVDIQEFKRQIELARGITADSPEKIRYYCTALQLYRGDFLPELYDDWVTQEQHWLKQSYLDAGRELGEVYLRHGEFDHLLLLTQAMLGVESCCEEASELTLKACVATGQRVQGLHYYQRMEQVLAKELEMSPNEELQALRQRLLVPSTSSQEPLVV